MTIKRSASDFVDISGRYIGHYETRHNATIYFNLRASITDHDLAPHGASKKPKLIDPLTSNTSDPSVSTLTNVNKNEYKEGKLAKGADCSQLLMEFRNVLKNDPTSILDVPPEVKYSRMTGMNIPLFTLDWPAEETMRSLSYSYHDPESVAFRI